MADPFTVELRKNIVQQFADDFAKAVLNSEAVLEERAPFDTGEIVSSITSSPTKLTPPRFEAKIVATADHALFTDTGTGEFGPRGRRITPRTKKALYWAGAEHPYASTKGSGKHKGWWSDADTPVRVVFDNTVLGNQS